MRLFTLRGDSGNKLFATLAGMKDSTLYQVSGNRSSSSHPGDEAMLLRDIDALWPGCSLIFNRRLLTVIDNEVNRNVTENLIYYYHPDHLGSSNTLTDITGLPFQHMEYMPFGETFVEENIGSYSTPYRFTSKELDDETGLYYYDARYYDPKLSMFLGVDPMADKSSNESSYIYCKNNPIIFIDPDGRTANPIYDFDGNLLGTDDKGLKGEALFMEEKDFNQGMSHDKAMKLDKGKKSLNGDKAIKKFTNSFSGLPERIDYDGDLTIDEVDFWYRNGNGQPLFVNLTSIDLGNISSEDFIGIGETDFFNLLLNGSSINDFIIYGSITLRLYPNDIVKAFSDKYDFEMHKPLWNPLNWPRNYEAYYGGKQAGQGKKFKIMINGSSRIRPTHKVIK